MLQVNAAGGAAPPLPANLEKIQLMKMRDPLTTPKLSQLQEVHTTTILEENETMRGSIDRLPKKKASAMVPTGGAGIGQRIADTLD